MLKIRLARGGAKKRPYYHIVVADSHSPRDGKFIEKVGSYNPMLPKDGAQPRVALKVERIAEWLGKGAQPTDRVARFLSQDETLGAKVKWTQGQNPNKAQPGKKAQERAAERAQRPRGGHEHAVGHPRRTGGQRAEADTGEDVDVVDLRHVGDSERAAGADNRASVRPRQDIGGMRLRA